MTKYTLPRIILSCFVSTTKLRKRKMFEQINESVSAEELNELIESLEKMILHKNRWDTWHAGGWEKISLDDPLDASDKGKND